MSNSSISVDITVDELARVALYSFAAAAGVMVLIASLMLGGVFPGDGWALFAPLLVLVVAGVCVGVTFAILVGSAFIISEISRFKP
jgi:ABC-type polysaccharide/polyol phosphate export permease